jgi:hypothetical protein
MENQKNYNLEIDEVIRNMCYIDIDTVITNMCSIKEEPKEVPSSFEENEYIPIENIIKPFYREMCQCIEMIKSNKYILKQTKNILGLEIKQERKNNGLMYKYMYIPIYHNKIKDCDRKKQAVEKMILEAGKPYDSRIEVLKEEIEKIDKRMDFLITQQRTFKTNINQPQISELSQEDRRKANELCDLRNKRRNAINEKKQDYKKRKDDVNYIKIKVPCKRINDWKYTPITEYSPLNLKTYDVTGKTSNKGCKALHYWHNVDYKGDKISDRWVFDGIKIGTLELICRDNGMPMTIGKKKIKYSYGDLSKFYMKC